MNNLLKKFEAYLFENLGIVVRTRKWNAEKKLPLFLRELYNFYTCSLENELYLLMVAQSNEEQTPASISKHVKMVTGKGGHDVIYLHPSISAYNRKRLIEQKVPFVVPGNQMYLPLLGIDLREHIRKVQKPKFNTFTPSTQSVILYVLYNKAYEGITPSLLSEHLNYSLMTIVRAFDEIEALGLGKVTTEGRERILWFNMKKQALWEESQKYFRSPVKDSVAAKPKGNLVPEVVSGLSALSRYSMLAEPYNPVFALTTERWKNLKERDEYIQQAIPLEDSFVIEIWTYDPLLFAENNTADRLSLYLSLRDTKDERVESALDAMMEQVSW